MTKTPAISIIVSLLAVMPTQTAASAAHRSIPVRIADLDLSTDSGRNILARRIHRAARSICDFASDRIDVKVRKIEKQCRTETEAAAWAKVDRQRRTAKR
jgi:UrcA family protein